MRRCLDCNKVIWPWQFSALSPALRVHDACFGEGVYAAKREGRADGEMMARRAMPRVKAMMSNAGLSCQDTPFYGDKREIHAIANRIK